MSSLMIEKIHQQLQDVAVLQKRIGDLAEVKESMKILQPQVIQTDFDIQLDISSWEKLFASPNAMKMMKQLQLSGEQVAMLLHYTYINGVSEKEWQTVAEKQELFFEKLTPHQGSNYMLRNFIVPLILDYVVNERQEEAFAEQVTKFTEAFDYRANEKKWCHHEVVQRMVEMVYQMDIQASLVGYIAEEQNAQTEQGRKEFLHLTDYLLKYKKNFVVNDDVIHFIRGYRLILQAQAMDLVEQIEQARGTQFANNIKELGERVHVTIPERTLKRLLYKQEDIISVLFHPYHEWAKKENNLYEVRARSRNGYYHEWERAKVKIQFIQKIILDNKKAFIKLYQEQEDALNLQENYKNVALFHPRFYEVVNVNTLNAATLKKATQLSFNGKAFNEIKDVITFQEFEFMNEGSTMQNKLYHLMSEWRIDDKIRVLRTLPPLQGFSGYRYSEEEFIETLLHAMKEKDFTHYTQYMKNRVITKTSSLFIHLYKKEFAHVIDEIHTDTDVDLLMKHPIKTSETLLEMKTRLYQHLQEIKSFTTFLGASPEFIQSNKRKFYEFYEKGLMHVVKVYKEALNGTQKENLRLLAKAEIANKLKEVKYRDEDFAKEIGIAVNSVIKKLWKEDTQSQKNKFIFKETSDFNHLIRMGQIPTSTCMSWSDGSYRECLLSIFDLNKKMLVAEKDGKVVARAVVRLTKVNEQATDIHKELNFLDVEKVDVEEVKVEGEFKGERLVLFLERLYTPVTGDERILIEREFISIINKKAQEMGVEMFLPTDYQVDSLEKEKVSIPMFISRSKNGKQYLDSLGGSSDESEGGKYHLSKVYKVIH